MWVWILLTGVLIAGWIVFSIIREAARQRQCYRTATRIWRESPPLLRANALKPLLDDLNINAPAWYLHGVALLREGRTREAARAFGIAHHADGNLETAALLTFATLKARDRGYQQSPGNVEVADAGYSDFVERVTETWEEMKRPEIARKPQDQQVLDCLESTTRDAPALSPLGRLIWLVSSPTDQSRLEQFTGISPTTRTAERYQGARSVLLKIP